MQSEIIEYLRQPRASRREAGLLRGLRQMPEEARYEIVKSLLSQSAGTGLRMASDSLQNKRYFEEIFKMGLEKGDASSIRFWLECAVPKLGFRKAVLILNNYMDTDPRAVEKALYWMGRFKPLNNLKADLAWNEIRTRRLQLEAEGNVAWTGSAMCRE